MTVRTQNLRIPPVAMHRRQHDVLVIVVMQRIEQLRVDAAEAAVAHHQHVVAGAGVFHQLDDEFLDLVEHARLGTQRGERLGGVPAEVGAVAVDEVGTREAGGQLRFHDAELHGVGARFQYGEDARLADLAAQAFDGGRDRGGVVGEVVVDGDAVHRAADFHAALDVLEAGQGIDRGGGGNAGVTRGSDRGERVHAVVLADQFPLHAALQRAVEEDVEAAVGIRFAGGPARGGTEALDRRPAAALEHAVEVGVGAVGDDEPVAGNGAHQVVELGLDGGEVGKDVGVVVLEVVEDDGTRTVVDELGALVEEGGVVFVGLDDEEGAVGQPRGHFEILRDAADQETGAQARIFEDPRQHGGGGGLAVGAGDGQHPFVLQNIVGQPLRTGGVGQAALEDGFHQRVAAGHDVADDEDIGLEVDLAGVPAFGQFDAERAQLVGHRRVDVGVAAGDGVAGWARDGGDAAHEGAADAEDVQMHDLVWNVELNLPRIIPQPGYAPAGSGG